jgi:hypothetical protein
VQIEVPYRPTILLQNDNVLYGVSSSSSNHGDDRSNSVFALNRSFALRRPVLFRSDTHWQTSEPSFHATLDCSAATAHDDDDDRCISFNTLENAARVVPSAFVSLNVIGGGDSGNGDDERGGGGGCLAATDTPMLLDAVEMTGCHARAGDGGALSVRGGSITIRDSTLGDNSAPLRGGALFAVDATVLLERVDVLNATSQRGGGLFFEHSVVELRSTSVTQCSATEHGGGVAMASDTTLAMHACRISHNVLNIAATAADANSSSSSSSSNARAVRQHGAAVYCDGTLLLSAEHSDFSSNRISFAEEGAGDIAALEQASVDVVTGKTGSVFGSGAAIFAEKCGIELRHCVFNNNTGAGT